MKVIDTLVGESVVAEPIVGAPGAVAAGRPYLRTAKSSLLPLLDEPATTIFPSLCNAREKA